MKNYGLIGPWRALSREAWLRCKGRLGAIWSQRRAQVEPGARLASSLRIRGSGEVIIRAGAIVEPDVSLVVEPSATIELGPGCRIGARTRLCAREGQHLVVGAETVIETDVTVVSVAGAVTGQAAVIGAGTSIVCREEEGAGRFALGDRSHLSTGNLVDICADVLIENEVRTGPNCAFYTHKHSPSPEQLIWDRPIATGPIEVADAVWIGHGCQVMPGVEIGRGAVVGAGAHRDENRARRRDCRRRARTYSEIPHPH